MSPGKGGRSRRRKARGARPGRQSQGGRGGGRGRGGRRRRAAAAVAARRRAAAARRAAAVRAARRGAQRSRGGSDARAAGALAPRGRGGALAAVARGGGRCGRWARRPGVRRRAALTAAASRAAAGRPTLSAVPEGAVTAAADGHLRAQPRPRGAAGPAQGASDLGHDAGRVAGRRRSSAPRRSRSGPSPTRTRASRALVDPYPYADADELLATRRPAAGRARRDHRPAEPRRDRAHGRGRRRDRRDHPRAALRPRSRPRSARRPRARSSTCAIARVRNLADFLARGQGGRLLGLRRGRRRDARATTSRTTPAGSSRCSAPRAKGCARGSRRCATTWSRCPLRGRIESLNVSATAAVLLYEMLQQRLDTST